MQRVIYYEYSLGGVMQIKLADGFNGHKVLFDDNAIAVDGDLVQLRCAEVGKEYMTAWKHKDEVAQAIEDQLPRKDFWDWLRKQERWPMTDRMMNPKIALTRNTWSDHVQIAIKTWSRTKARDLADKALKVPPQEMEQFLAEVLVDALLTYNDTYLVAYNQHVHQMERMMEAYVGTALPPSVITKGI